MLAKALLSIVGALFIGSQLVHATVLPTCGENINTNCGKDVPEDSYCITSGGVIYNYGVGTNSVANDCTTKVSVTNEYQVFLNGAPLGSTDTIDGTTKDNLEIYHCTGVNNVNCRKTYGYVLNNNQYLTIDADGTSNGFKALGDLATVASLSGSCTVGELYNDGDTAQKLCLSNTPNVFSQDISTATAKSYVLNNVAGNVFTNVAGGSGDENEPIIVQVGGGKIVLSNSGYDYCPEDNSTKEVKETFNEFCGSANDPCDGNPYECAAITGICTRQIERCEIKNGSSPNCEDGYYIVSSDADGNQVYAQINEINAPGQLFECDNHTCGPKSTGFVQGYYKNKAGGDVEYIACSAQGKCTAVGISTSCGAAGQIINDGGLKLCLDVNVPSGVLGTATGSHFISINTANVFGNASSGKYVEIVFDGTEVKLVAAASQVNRKYVYTDGTYKIYAKENKSGVCGVSGGTLIEFKENTGYEKHAETKRPVSI